MSISQLLQPNAYNLFGKSLNGITTEEITGVNSNGQVLTIVNKDDKVVAFVDPEAGIPDTLGFPDGYVLKIIDNTTNEINWEPDAGTGATVPFILTGDNVNALTVRNTTLDSKLRVDTIDDQVLLTAQKTIVQGADDDFKLAVYTDADGVNPVMRVITTNGGTGLVVGGSQDAPQKFGVENSIGATMFNINSLDGIATFKNPFLPGVIARIDTADGKIKLDNSENLPSVLELYNTNVGINQYKISVEPDGDTTRITANRIKTDASANIITGANDRGKFVVATNTDVPVLNVDTDGQTVSVGEFGGTNDVNKFRVSKSDGNNLLSVDTVNKKIKFNGTSPGKAELVFLDAPETLPVGVPSSVNMKMGYDEGGGGDTNFVGYIASNGPNSVYNVVNNGATGLFFVAPNCGIQTTAVNTIIGSQTANSSCDIEFQDTIRLVSANSCSIDIGGNSDITISSASNVIISSGLETQFQNLVNMGTNYPYMDPGIVALPTQPKELTTKEYVDKRDGYLFSSIANTASSNQTSPLDIDLLSGTASSGSTLTVLANSFVVGDSFHLNISGTCNFLGTAPNATTGNPTALNLTLTLRSNGTALNTIIVPTKNTGASSFFECETDFTIRSLGVGGAIANSFEFTYQIPSTTNFEGSRNTTIGTIDTTINNTLTCFAELQAGYAAASVQGLMAVLRKTH